MSNLPLCQSSPKVSQTVDHLPPYMMNKPLAAYSTGSSSSGSLDSYGSDGYAGSASSYDSDTGGPTSFSSSPSSPCTFDNRDLRNVTALPPVETSRITTTEHSESRDGRSTSFCNYASRQAYTQSPPPLKNRAMNLGITIASRTYEEFQKKNMKRRRPVGRSMPSLKSPPPAPSTSNIYNIGYDTMANICSYLKQTETHTLLTSPLSKTFSKIYVTPQDLWRILCLSPPFFARLDEEDSDSTGDLSDDSTMANSKVMVSGQMKLQHVFGRCRLLYTSFVQCVKYIERIREDVRVVKGTTVKVGTKRPREDSSSSDDDSDEEEMSQKNKKSKKRPLVFSKSEITHRLLGPPSTTSPGQTNLHYSCAIYSVVNWMVAFSDVLGIQIICLKILPELLEDEKQRTVAQRAGLTDIVLTAMVLFPCSVELHIAAFHAIVLLARPLGGHEGMLFHSKMVDASGVFQIGTNSGKNGIAVMLDSMRRFEGSEILQAMGCWSMVNVALIPSQKTMLVKLGGIGVVVRALLCHATSVEVQFRALFALINLVIPSKPYPQDSPEHKSLLEHLGSDISSISEKEMLDEHVSQITNSVVVAMKNFFSSQAIMNRACLVLHNLSLTEGYHRIMLWTPNCYQMLEWAVGNYLHDPVLQKSAASALERLQVTLSGDADLRDKFVQCLRERRMKPEGAEAVAR